MPQPMDSVEAIELLTVNLAYAGGTMQRLILTFSVLALTSACSDSRDRRVPADEPELAADLRLPDSSTQATPAPKASTRPKEKINTLRKGPRRKPVVEAQ